MCNKIVYSAGFLLWTLLWLLTKLPRLPSRLSMGTPSPHTSRHLRPLDLDAFGALLPTSVPQYKFLATTLHATHPCQKILATPLTRGDLIDPLWDEDVKCSRRGLKS